MAGSRHTGRFDDPNPQDVPSESIPQGLDEARVDYTPGEDNLEADSHVEQVRFKHERQLLSLADVVGVGIRLGPIGDDVIVVYVRSPQSHDSILKELEGVAVEVEVTGEIDAL